MSDFLSFFTPLRSTFHFLGKYWWIYAPALLFFGVLQLYQNYTRTRYLKKLKWILLEIKPPPDVMKSPKTAESIYAGLHGIYAKPLTWKKKFFEGKLQDWFSLEIVSNQGEMKFFVRTLEDHRNLVESQIFAQYPDAEITPADDYMAQMPPSLPNNDYDLFGAELIFTKEDAYPIKTYEFFEEQGGKDEFARTDPLAPLAETMSMVGPGEHLWLQLLIRPTGGEWAEKGKVVVDKILDRAPKQSANAFVALIQGIEAFINLFLPASVTPEVKPKEGKEVIRLTPGEKFVLEQVQNKLSKLAFKAGYRFLYVAKKDSFNRARISSVIGMFKQMYSNNLNTFRPNGTNITVSDGYLKWLFPSDKGFFVGPQEYRRKYKMYQRYKKRQFVSKVVILNTEELATLYHLPGLTVKAPAFPRVEAKTGQPPIQLPTRE